MRTGDPSSMTSTRTSTVGREALSGRSRRPVRRAAFVLLTAAGVTLSPLPALANTGTTTAVTAAPGAAPAPPGPPPPAGGPYRLRPPPPPAGQAVRVGRRRPGLL